MTTIDSEWHSGNLVPGTTPGFFALHPREFNGWDIHVLRNTTSVPLRALLALQEDNGNYTRADAAALPADVTNVIFTGEINAPIVNNRQTVGGVTLDITTGAVTATANPPTPRLRTFLITPRILRASGLLQGPQIRVHVHESVTDIWLTPSPLTVAGDADGQRFTVLARFDDDTVGDITYLVSAPPAAGQPPTSGFTWASSDNVCAQVDARGGLTGVFTLSACTSTITVTLQQPGWPALTATAEVRVVEDWATQPTDRRELHLLSGPGATAFADVPNILFLPDGFLDTPQDRNDFFALAGLAVQRLNRSVSTTPFDVLEGAINYWCAFVPSRESGSSTLDDLAEETSLFETPLAVAAGNATPPAVPPVTTLFVDGEHAVGKTTIDFAHAPLAGGELPAGVHVTISGHPMLYETKNRVAAVGGKVRGVQLAPALVAAAHAGTSVTVIGRRASVPKAILGQPNAPGWSIQNLIHAVGLPVRAEALTAPSTATQLQAKVGDWTTLYGAARIPAAVMNTALYDQWGLGLPLGGRELALPDHRLANEKDTAFGLATGERPRAQARNGEQGITWHPQRTLRSNIDPYLATLEFQGTIVGTTWVAHTPTGPAKDASFVFVLASGARYAGANASGAEPIIALGLVDDQNVRVEYGAARSMRIVSHPMPRDPGNAPRVTGFVHSTIAHEAAHSFNILDEYTANRGTLAPTNTTAQQRSFFAGNITTGAEAIVNGRLVGERLRWRWPRILKASVLANPPTLVAGHVDTYKITLVPGRPFNLRGDLFTVGDPVFLRQRQLVRPAAGNPLAFTPALESAPMIVTVAISDFEFEVQVLPGGTLNPADFSATGAEAPIMFHPAAATAIAATTDRYAEVMSQFIRTHLTTTGGPLNAPSATPTRLCVPGLPSLEAQAATNLPAPPPNGFPAIRSRIIGAYEGGMEFECGVFHPAGSCIMRSPLATATETQVTGDHLGDVHGFCHVCRYLLIDHIEPRRHFMIDFFYHDYPQP